MTISSANPIFVMGPQKTGTSTLVGILNCHPSILILFEAEMFKSQISKYGNRLVSHTPEARKFFRYSSDISSPYLSFQDFVYRKYGSSYSYIGDKIITLHPLEISRPGAHKTIFTARDIKTWLAKPQIIKAYRTDLDIVPAAVDYIRYVVQSRMLSNSIVIKLEDLVKRNNAVLDILGVFLELDLKYYAEDWWNKIDYSEDELKNALRWQKGHRSSAKKPDSLDTNVTIRTHSFWDDALPMFRKYYEQDQDDIDHAEAKKDIEKLELLLEHSPLPLEHAYDEVLSQRLNRKKQAPGKKDRALFIKRAFRRFDRVKQAALGRKVLK